MYLFFSFSLMFLFLFTIVLTWSLLLSFFTVDNLLLFINLYNFLIIYNLFNFDFFFILASMIIAYIFYRCKSPCVLCGRLSSSQLVFSIDCYLLIFCSYLLSLWYYRSSKSKKKRGEKKKIRKRKTETGKKMIRKERRIFIFIYNIVILMY